MASSIKIIRTDRDCFVSRTEFDLSDIVSFVSALGCNGRVRSSESNVFGCIKDINKLNFLLPTILCVLFPMSFIVPNR